MKVSWIFIGLGLLVLMLFRKKSTTPSPAQPNSPFAINLGKFGTLTVPRGSIPADAPLYTWNPKATNPNYNPISNPQLMTASIPTQQSTVEQVALVAKSLLALAKPISELGPRNKAQVTLPQYTQNVLGPGDSLYSYATGPNGAFYRPDSGTIPVPADEPVTVIDLPAYNPQPESNFDFNYDWA